ncbi:MAG: hypothetical protein JKY53_03590 [Flavobacteriales bacterium]|nr:hypothetical protein [Flavobacteriales bacterium]
MKISISFLFLLFTFFSSSGQSITTYTDYLQKFYVFDNYKIQKLEHLPIKSVKVSDDYLAYEDNVNNFNVYYNGKNTQLEGLVNSYSVYKGMIIYETAGIIWAYTKGEKLVLSTRTISYKAADNIVAFIDVYDRAFKIFTDTIHVLETHTVETVVESYFIAPNTLAYIDAQQNFYYYANGEKHLVAEYFEGNYREDVISYRVGENIIAYVDNYDYTFKTYYNEESNELDSQLPASFKMGKNMVAWVANDGTFSVFYDGEITELASYPPSIYTIKDDILTYVQNGYFYLFYKGKKIEVEPFVPSTYYKDNHTLVYIDQTGYVKAYIDGKFIEITRQPNTDFKLNGNVIYYTVNQNEPRIWFKGEELEF